jgi:hypothetical protein
MHFHPFDSTEPVSMWREQTRGRTVDQLDRQPHGKNNANNNDIDRRP